MNGSPSKTVVDVECCQNLSGAPDLNPLAGAKAPCRYSFNHGSNWHLAKDRPTEFVQKPGIVPRRSLWTVDH